MNEYFKIKLKLNDVKKELKKNNRLTKRLKDLKMKKDERNEKLLIKLYPLFYVLFFCLVTLFIKTKLPLQGELLLSAIISFFITVAFILIIECVSSSDVFTSKKLIKKIDKAFNLKIKLLREEDRLLKTLKGLKKKDLLSMNSGELEEMEEDVFKEIIIKKLDSFNFSNMPRSEWLNQLENLKNLEIKHQINNC